MVKCFHHKSFCVYFSFNNEFVYTNTYVYNRKANNRPHPHQKKHKKQIKNTS